MKSTLINVLDEIVGNKNQTTGNTFDDDCLKTTDENINKLKHRQEN